MIKVMNVITQNMLLISKNLIWNYYYFVKYLSKLLLINFIDSFMNFMNLYKVIIFLIEKWYFKRYSKLLSIASDFDDFDIFSRNINLHLLTKRR